MTQAIGTPAFQAIADTLLLQVDHRWTLQQQAAQIAAKGGDLYYGGMGEHFGFQLVVGDCLSQQVRGVLKHDLDQWQIDYVQACQIALANLGRITDMMLGSHDLDGRPQCYETIWQKGDHAARALLATIYDVDVPGESIFFPVGHGKAFIVGDQTRFGLTVVITALLQSEKEGFLMPPFGIDMQGHAWPPRTHHMYKMFSALQYKYMSKIYELQRDVLLQKRTPDNDYFVARFTLVNDKQNQYHSTATVSESGKVTLLPEVDKVVFCKIDLDSESGPTNIIVDWERVLERFGDRIKQTKDYPNRYAFSGFPSDSELAALQELH